MVKLLRFTLLFKNFLVIFGWTQMNESRQVLIILGLEELNREPGGFYGAHSQGFEYLNFNSHAHVRINSINM